MEDIECFSCLREALIGGVRIGMLQCRVTGKCDIAIAGSERGYCAQICWRVAVRGTPSIL